jgi:hypothetical protein
MINIKYSTFFSVKLLHQYFADLVCPDFTLIPSEETRRTLAGLKMITRSFSNEILTGVELNSSGNPPVIPGEGTNFTWFLTLKNSSFLNYTNLRVAPVNGMLYYFSNRNNNTFGGSDLTENINAYSSGASYLPGSMVVSPSGNVFQAWRKNDAGNPHGISDPDYWIKLGKNSYTSENEAVKWLPSILQYSFPSLQTSVTILVKGYQSGTRAFTGTVLSKTINFASPAGSFTLDLSPLSPGRYVLQIDGGTETPVYLNDELYGRKVFGVIDLYCESTLPGSYRMLDVTNHLLSPAYRILFPNRLLLWKYILQHNSAGTLLDDAGVFQFAPDASLTPVTLVSQTPIPLSETPIKTFKLKVDPNIYTSIPNASPDRLSSYQFHRGLPDEETLTCSEINLNY